MKKLVIMLHGVGSNGADLAPIAAYWQRSIPELEFASPDAPFRFMNSPEAFQWFDLAGITEQNRPERIINARTAFDATVTQILDQHQMLDKLEQVVFCGFSQGSMMALDVVASGRWQIAGVIAMSGRLATPIEAEASRQSKVLLLHGMADQVVPAQESIQAEQKLAKAGFEVQLHTYADLAHAVNEDELQKGLSFLKQVLH